MHPRRSRSRSRGGRRRLRRALPALGMMIGIALLAAPLAMDVVTSALAGRQVTSMSDRSDGIDPGERRRLLLQARSYNRVLAGERTEIPTSEIWDYERQLNGEDGRVVSGIEVPSIGVRLPVRLGTGDDVLSSGVGHLEGSSLPVGGRSTHAVLMGHSGLYGSRMFDDIRKLRKGDHFRLRTLGRTLEYAVVETGVVKPEGVRGLKVSAGEDLCTLVTCTPYGVNDHRLLVTGRRTRASAVGKERASDGAANSRVIPLAAGMTTAAFGCLANRIRKGRSERRHVVSSPRHMASGKGVDKRLGDTEAIGCGAHDSSGISSPLAAWPKTGG
ncbi:class C sortase [Parafannyhessea umbonata]|uniref:class C sortase n=1 Tax=Parafannyhessea umbonata TaxID=604330 RepID=UPI00359C5AC9